MFQKKDMPTENMTMTVVEVSVDKKNVLLLNDTGNYCSVYEDLKIPLLTDEMDIDFFFEMCERKVHVTKQGEELIVIAMDT